MLLLLFTLGLGYLLWFKTVWATSSMRVRMKHFRLFVCLALVLICFGIDLV